MLYHTDVCWGPPETADAAAPPP